MRKHPFDIIINEVTALENNFNENEEIIIEKIKDDKKKKKGKLRAFIVFVMGLFVGAFVGIFLFNKIFFSGDLIAHGKLSAVMRVLDIYYLRDYDRKALSDMAAKAAALSVEDPYTEYYTAEEFDDLMDSSNGDFVGIGATVSVTTDNEIIVLETIPGSPAQRAGIMPEDILLKVEGEDFSGDRLQEAIKRIRGTDNGKETGVEVNITIRRGQEIIDLKLTRERIHTDSVSYKMLDNNIGYIKIDSFNTKTGKEKDTYEEFTEAIDDLKSQNAQKLIFDVRDNGGGDADVVSKMLDYLLPEGVIMYTEDKHGNRDERKSSAGELDMEMVVITNARSASASELFTGALKDYDKATVVGEKTFGKGVVQIIIPLSDGSGMKVTNSSYFTPKGTCVQGIGISPDIAVELAEADKNKYAKDLEYAKDTQLQKAVEILNG